MAGNFLSLTGGELRPANVADLEAELSALWKSAAEDPETHHAVTRSCALTLLVYVEHEDDEREVLDLLAGITPQNPCRAVIMIAERDATPAGLSARITANCQLPAAGEKQVCCDQVSILARGEAVSGLDQVVIPLMVPDLPVYLWWRAGRFFPGGDLELILRSTDRVLVDSARFPVPDSDLPSFFDHVRKRSGETVFTDLNWARLTPWRELVAQCFDSPETRPYLDLLTDVRIEYELDSPRLSAQHSQALLLVGWLASRLNWQPMPETVTASNNGRSFLLRSGAETVQAQCVARQFEGGGAGLCFSLVLKARGVSSSAFYLGRGPDGMTAITRREIPGRPILERGVRLEVMNEVELVNEEIKFAWRDRVYEDALGMVAQLMPAPK